MLPVLSIVLLGVSSTLEQKRSLREPLIGIWILAVVLASWRGITPYSYPGIFLTSAWAWIGVFCLTCFAPSAQWISRRVVWLCLVNAVLAISQMIGFDPVFVVHGRPTGFLNRSNLLCVLLLSGIPISRRPVSILLAGVVLALRTAMGFAGLAGLLAFSLVKRANGKVLKFAILLSLPGLSIVLTRFFVGNLNQIWNAAFSYRLKIWNLLVTQSAWSPLYGYGNGFWNTVTPYPGDTCTYNQYLAAMHAGGALLLVPLAWAAWKVFKEKASNEKTSLLVLIVAALWEDIWNFQRMMVVTIALVSCLLIRREET